MAGRYGQPEIDYVLRLATALHESQTTPAATSAACARLLSGESPLASIPAETVSFGAPRGAGLRNLDALRHSLMADTGQSPADWDLIDPATGRLAQGPGSAMSGMRVYCEDIRSPFNLGSIFRSCDAFGAGELILSPGCADPEHPRCARSAMGATTTIASRRAGLEVLGPRGPAFALELGGTDISEFAFPREGIVVLGSEELGVSREALELCPLGKVTIPMSGAKASINVAVAFGILAHAWRSYFVF